MAALIGLFAGAFIGNLVWHEWGAALGGVAGFLVGVRFLGRRTPGAGASAAAATGGAPPPAGVPGTRGQPAMHDEERALSRRVEELERRVASLERVLERSAGEGSPKNTARSERFVRRPWKRRSKRRSKRWSGRRSKRRSRAAPNRESRRRS